MNISDSLEHFLYFNFEIDFLENENFFQKTGVLFFNCTIVERIKIEKTSFPFKTVISEGQIEWYLQNGPITEDRGFCQ